MDTSIDHTATDTSSDSTATDTSSNSTITDASEQYIHTIFYCVRNLCKDVMEVMILLAIVVFAILGATSLFVAIFSKTMTTQEFLYQFTWIFMLVWLIGSVIALIFICCFKLYKLSRCFKLYRTNENQISQCQLERN